MGGWQAAFSGLGQTGEDLGAGMNQALTEALKVRAQTHLENMDQSHLALAQAGQKQAYDLAQQQHELMRQQLLQNNQEDLGLAFDAKTGGYVRNMRDKTTNKITGYPLGPNVYPPDSPEMQMISYKNLVNMTKDGTPTGPKVFTAEQAREKAFNLAKNYRLDPVSQLQAFREDGQQLKDDGVARVSIPGFGVVDFSKPGAVEQYAQWQLQAQRPQGLGALLRAETMGKPIDQTGWTANEQREYKVEEFKAKQAEQQALAMYREQLQLPMNWSEEGQKRLHDALIQATQEAQKGVDTKEAEIGARHGRGTTPAAGQRWSKSAWAAAHPGQDANAAAAYAKAQGATVIP